MRKNKNKNKILFYKVKLASERLRIKYHFKFIEIRALVKIHWLLNILNKTCFIIRVKMQT